MLLTFFCSIMLYHLNLYINQINMFILFSENDTSTFVQIYKKYSFHLNILKILYN